MTNRALPPEPEKHLRDLAVLAKSQRDALLASLSAVSAKLSPTYMKTRAQHQFLDTTLDSIAKLKTAVARHPARALGVAAVIGALLARRPLFRISGKCLHSVYSRISQIYHGRHRQRDEEDEC